MEFKAQTRTQQVLTVMLILAWVVFIGYMIEAGAILVSYGISLVNPEASKDLYRGLNLYNLRQFDFWYYSLAVSFLAALSIMKAGVSFLVIRILSKFSIQNPFTAEVAGRLEKISYAAFGVWLVTMLSNGYTSWLLKATGELHGTWLSGEFIFMVGLIFIISKVFRRGVEIQSENDLTI